MAKTIVDKVKKIITKSKEEEKKEEVKQASGFNPDLPENKQREYR